MPERPVPEEVTATAEENEAAPDFDRIAELTSGLVGEMQQKLEGGDYDEADDARALVLGEMNELVDKAKTEAGDYTAAHVGTAIALAMAASAEQPSEVAQLHYEDHGNPYYDLIGIESTYGGFARVNIPVSFIRPEFLDKLREKYEGEDSFDMEDRAEHDRQHEPNLTEVFNGAYDVYEYIGELSETTDIEAIVEEVFGEPGDEYANERLAKQILALVAQCRIAREVGGEGISKLVGARTRAIRLLEDENQEELRDYWV